MANIKQALELSNLQQKKATTPSKKMSALQIAQRVFQLAAQAGHPFQGTTPKEWAKKWLASDEFVRTEIPAGRVALPTAPMNSNRVLQNLSAAADSMEPIVVDLNKQKIGRSPIGFVPPIIVVDGKHRHTARTMQGHSTIEAWVGLKAIDKLLATAMVEKAIESKPVSKRSKIESAAILNMPRQDVAENGSAPHRPMPGVKGGKVYGMGGGQAGLGSGSGPTAPPVTTRVQASDPSDVTPHKDPSDRYDKPLGQSIDPSDEENSYGNVSPNDQAPGAGVGNRLPPNKGASKSELQDKLFSKGIKVDKIYEEMNAAMKAGKFKFTKQMMGVAPPGRESQVMELKKKYGEKSPIPFQIAWHQYNQKG